MKNNYFLIACMTIVAATTMPLKVQAQNPFGEEFYELPCMLYDSDDVFAGTSMAIGFPDEADVVRRAALTNAQNIVRQKMEHAYEGMVTDFMSLIGGDGSSRAASTVEAAGSQMIKTLVKDTKEKCIKTSPVNDKGKITIFVGIEINKRELAAKVADKVEEKAAEVLQDDKELAIRFKESNFRERMEQKFKEQEAKAGNTPSNN
jgi:hypothetical protein